MGKLVIYTGPMKCGKTTKLIEQYNKMIEKSTKVRMFKPSIDTRYSSVRVVARNVNQQILCTLLNDIDMLWYFKDMYKYFFIDEFQFLQGDITVIKKLLDIGKNIWVSGLNLTAENKPFGLMGDLMCYADKVYFLKGNCDNCNKPNSGKYTYFNGNKSEDILVGDTNYQCVCPKCYNILTKQ